MDKEQNLKELFALNLKNRRKVFKLTQADLANKINVSTSFITEIESGRKAPSFSTIEKLSNVLEAPVWTFFCQNSEKININSTEKEKLTFELKNEIINSIDNFIKNKF